MTKTAPNLVLENVGPIRRADVTFGDLSILVGPQATGKSLFLQFLKLVLDHVPVTAILQSHGLDWGKDLSVWLATGRVYLAPSDPKRRLLTQRAVLLVAGRLNLDSLPRRP